MEFAVVEKKKYYKKDIREFFKKTKPIGAADLNQSHPKNPWIVHCVRLSSAGAARRTIRYGYLAKVGYAGWTAVAALAG